MGLPAAVPAAVAWAALVVAARRWGRRGRPPPQDQAAVVFLAEWGFLITWASMIFNDAS